MLRNVADQIARWALRHAFRFCKRELRYLRRRRGRDFIGPELDRIECLLDGSFYGEGGPVKLTVSRPYSGEVYWR